MGWKTDLQVMQPEALLVALLRVFFSFFAVLSLILVWRVYRLRGKTSSTSRPSKYFMLNW
jgi:membrane protein implicated in regulation of membrane protease activity